MPTAQDQIMLGEHRHRLHLAVFCLGALLTGCASFGPQLPTATLDETESQEGTFAVRTLKPDGEFEMLPSAEVARRLQARLGERPLSILALSVGGASGAFGAGALVGSTRSGQRPEFSVVTGVSAGALLAPFAFLGPAWDAELTAIYSDGVTDGVLRRRLLGGVFDSSVYSPEPLRQIIERYTSDAMIAAIAAEADKGRLLLVATTDFATGEPVIWDLGSIALHGGDAAKSLIQTLLLASASVPGMLPPVLVRFRSEGRVHAETHVDGGVTLPFFVAPAPTDLPASTGNRLQRTRVHVIIDGRLRDFPRAAHANALSIFRRSVSAGLSRMMRATLESTVAALHQRGIAVDFAAIPTSYPERGAFNFRADAQRALFQYASACAVAGRLWTRVQPGAAGPVLEPANRSDDRTCPADDAFLGRFAALEDHSTPN
jgi:predicted acylesterase/phospholipase RssA